MSVTEQRLIAQQVATVLDHVERDMGEFRSCPRMP